ncbi:MAG: hypothetical protein JWL71_4385 [Acidobacteria bacterium]|nr:hypothetical protein [Acidobacteriota bacterium]
MLTLSSRLAAVAAACLAVSACSKSNSPTQPTAAATAVADGAAATASVTVPRPLSPAAGAAIRNVDQPVTLVVANAVLTQSAGATYTFEVSTDSTFGTKVYAKSGVAAGSTGQTSLTIDKIAAGTSYFWRARAEGGGTTGPFSAPRAFAIGPAIVIDSATLVSPITGAGTSARPTFTVTNATRSGPIGALTYKFEVAANAAFSPVLISGTVAEGVGRTSFTPSTDLPAETTLFWRVTVSDIGNGVTGPTTLAASFVTTFAIDLKKVVYLNSPDVSGWPQTAVLSLVEQDGGGDGPVCMSYTDPGWPDSHWPFGGEDPNFGVYANQWYFARIGGTWYGGAGEWIYRGASSCKAGQGTRTIGPDAGFGPPFNTWVPQVGELVGFMVSSVARNGPVKRTVDERSNVIVQPWRDSSLGSRALGRIQ